MTSVDRAKWLCSAFCRTLSMTLNLYPSLCCVCILHCIATQWRVLHTRERDPCVRSIAEKGLHSEELVQRKKFRPAIIVRDTMQQDPSLSRKALRVAAKRSVTKEDDHARLSQLQSLPRQGHMVRSFPPNMPAVWAKAVQGLLDEQFKFALNAAHDTLPHNANLEKEGPWHLHLCGDDH